MQVLSAVPALRAALGDRQGIVLVPTMGNLHDGHISLMQQARQHGQTVVASVFVNPLQFGPTEDFAAYPRTLEADRAKLEAAGVDFLFAPGVEDLYPEPQTYRVEVPEIQHWLEGETRPGHFVGAATVVLKLFNIVQPQAALFGKKDYQQLMILRNMARQFALPIRIIGGEIVRAPDGLALSSRNGYLSPAERAEAPRLHRELTQLADAVRSGERDFARLETATAAALDSHGWKTDYVSVRRQADLQPPGSDDRTLVVLAASRLGKTRLIDNIEI